MSTATAINPNTENNVNPFASMFSIIPAAIAPIRKGRAAKSETIVSVPPMLQDAINSHLKTMDLWAQTSNAKYVPIVSNIPAVVTVGEDTFSRDQYLAMIATATRAYVNAQGWHIHSKIAGADNYNAFKLYVTGENPELEFVTSNKARDEFRVNYAPALNSLRHGVWIERQKSRRIVRK